MRLDRLLQRRTVEVALDVGERLGNDGVGRLEDHDVRGLQTAEFLDPAPGDAELVMVEHDVGRQGAHRLVDRADLGLAQQQMVAVGIGARRHHATVGRRAVDIGARHDDDAHLGEQRRELALGQRGSERQHRLAARRLVAMLLADQPHHGTAEGADRRRIVEALSREIEHGNVAALRRAAEAGQPRLPGVADECHEEVGHRLLAGERGLGQAEGRAVERHARNRGIVRQHRSTLAIVRGRPLLGRRRAAHHATRQERQDESEREGPHAATPRLS